MQQIGLFTQPEPSEERYYSVPLKSSVLEKHGYQRNEYGRFEKEADPNDTSFERRCSCPSCGFPVIGYRKQFARNGMLQVVILCENHCNRYAKQDERSKGWARKIRGEL